MENRIKDLVYIFMDGMVMINYNHDENYDYYMVGDRLSISINRKDHNIIWLNCVPEYVHKFIPIDYNGLRKYIKSWVKEKYVNGR